jgi:hypothetical protein
MKKVSLLTGLLIALAAAPALAVPSTMNFTGRLTTATGPVSGNVSVTFRLFNSLSGGTAVWSETHATVMADMGLVYVDLGATSALDESVFDGTVKYLEVVVNGETLSPRMALNAVPYAQRTIAAETSDTLGTLTPSDVVTTVNGTSGISAVKNANTVAVSLATSGCSNGQVYKYSGSAWACAADADTTYTAGAGINITGNAISLSTANCVNGQVLKFNGTAFACQADLTGSYAAGAGLSLTGTTFAVDSTVIPTLAGNNTFSGANTFSNASNSFTGTHSGNGAALTNLNAANIATGTLGIGRGGTNQATIGSAGSVVYSTGTQYNFTSAGTAGQLLASAGANQPAWTSTPSVSSLSVSGNATISGTASIGYERVAGAAVDINTAVNCSVWGGTTCYSASNVQASCPTGKVVLGGGCMTINVSTHDAFIARSAPVSNTAWRCDAAARGNTGQLIPHVICARIL